MNIKHIVISAVNLNQGGTLTVAQELLHALDQHEEIKVTALVHKTNLYPVYKNIKLVEMPEVKKSWLKRLYFEYVYSRKLSEKLKADIWFCAHDMTANVNTKKRYVYCHNPSPFYQDLSLSDLRNDYKFWLFVHLYRFLYLINIKKNTAIFVQQHWIANAFKETYGIDNVIVSRPETLQVDDNDFITNDESKYLSSIGKNDGEIRVFYPSVPRVFKNFEVLLEAAAIFSKRGNNKISFSLTFDGSENRYSRQLYKKYSHLKNVEFLGYLTKNQMEQEYSKSDLVCFPSKLETWGLPITEAKGWDKPLVVADLDYAHETVGKYDKVCFFNPDKPYDLVEILTSLSEGEKRFQSVSYTSSALNGWSELVKFILKG
jgi:glycosyltransferase involved in cell wall biosynthesis